MKYLPSLIAIVMLAGIHSSVHAFEYIDKKGAFNSKTFGGNIYTDRGKYSGMITPEGKMYNAEGEFTGQIRNQTILDMNGDSKGFIREGKIYDKEGNYKGRLRR